MTEPLTATQAAQLAAKAQQGHAERNREAITPALDYADAQIREAAGGPAGLTGVQLNLRPFNLNPEQLLAFTRTLSMRGFQVRAHLSSSDVVDVGWKPVTTRSPTLPGQQHLTE
ncbi:hypothetical protein [Deinococcus radiotolerans]|uniref:Amidohydrolase n=1 Tax=Deinococcus radiotolerans TaxID=1309407 RepID=A0ABQ2FR45_9DEIO|nr:hypothetical protein [Deinococcus radiotolerans]GGL18421.1 hypothetical protein GCM10010844_41560 [Deinococcus radiotolerans]